ncbi:MAG: flagellar protein FlaG [Nitrospirae bacterium]|nr:flagellar protein FlaG [Nitrospirota bacterium]
MTAIGPITTVVKSPPDSRGFAAEAPQGERVVPAEGPAAAARSAAAAMVADRAPAPDQAKEAVRDLGETLKALNLNIRIEHSINNKTKDVVVKIVSGDSGEVIRQIPSEEVVALRERLADLVGVLFRGKA